MQTAKLTRIHLTDYHATSLLLNVAVTKHQLNVSTAGAVFYSAQGELPVVSNACLQSCDSSTQTHRSPSNLRLNLK